MYLAGIHPSSAGGSAQQNKASSPASGRELRLRGPEKQNLPPASRSSHRRDRLPRQQTPGDQDVDETNLGRSADCCSRWRSFPQAHFAASHSIKTAGVYESARQAHHPRVNARYRFAVHLRPTADEHTLGRRLHERQTRACGGSTWRRQGEWKATDQVGRGSRVSRAAAHAYGLNPLTDPSDMSPVTGGSCVRAGRSGLHSKSTPRSEECVVSAASRFTPPTLQVTAPCESLRL